MSIGIELGKRYAETWGPERKVKAKLYTGETGVEMQWVDHIETQSLKGQDSMDTVPVALTTQSSFPVGCAVLAYRTQRKAGTYCGGWQGDWVPKNGARPEDALFSAPDSSGAIEVIPSPSYRVPVRVIR